LKVAAVAWFFLLLTGWLLAARGTAVGAWRGWVFLSPERQRHAQAEPSAA